MFLRLLFFLPLFFLLPGLNYGQQGKDVQISGQVILPGNADQAFNLLVVNARTAKGVFGEKDGTFAIQAQKDDTILVGAIGYKTVKISMKDSIGKDSYHIRVFLEPISYSLKEVRILPRRELDSIQQDIRGLGYDETDFMLSGIDAFYSPITFLYQEFSRKEQQKRYAYKLMNEDRMRDLLKQLFVRYIDYDIIDLDQSEFDDFIDFMGVSERQLKSFSQYDFIIYTKEKFKQFRNSPPRLRQDINTHD